MKHIYDDLYWSKRTIAKHLYEEDNLENYEPESVTRFRMLLIDEFSGTELTWPENIVKSINKPDGSFTVEEKSSATGEKVKGRVRYYHFANPDDSSDSATFVEMKMGSRGLTYYYCFLETHMTNSLKELLEYLIKTDELEFISERKALESI